ncbi:MAG: pilus assembly protein [Candidatus Dechloromonas phosphoritropha]|jgi:type IV pilus assembly protein PilX
MKFTPNSRSTATNKQNGFVLVTSILFLVILTLIVLAMMRTSILEERMVGNSRDWNNAFQAAESGLRDAEREILDSKGRQISGLTGFVSDCTDGLCLPNVCPSNTDCSPVWVKLAATDSLWKSGTGTPSKSVGYGAYTSAVALPGLPTQPRYIIEALTVPGTSSLKVKPGGSGSNTVYRVTAVGYGLNTSSRVMLQSYVRPN